MLLCASCAGEVPVLDLVTFLRSGATCPTCGTTYIVMCIPQPLPLPKRGETAVLITGSPGANVTIDGIVAGGDVVIDEKRVR